MAKIGSNLFPESYLKKNSEKMVNLDKLYISQYHLGSSLLKNYICHFYVYCTNKNNNYPKKNKLAAKTKRC
jgi:hypothetical protein